MPSIKDKVVMITGASSGIGRATAKELTARRAKVMLVARREDLLKELKEEIEQAGGNAHFKITDITSRQQVKNAVDAAIDRFGQIDVLFNNAGIMPLSFMQKLHVDEWDRMVDVNIKGVLYGIAGVLPSMIKRNQGHIINVSSTAGHVVFPGAAVYCGTKYAVRAITEGLRLELHPKTKIRVTLISPGAVATELGNTITDQDVIDMFKLSKVTPLNSESIARAVCYAIEQPEDVDVNEIIIRPISQYL